MPLANDSSFGVGFAPLSQLERLVFEAEQYLNSPKLKKVLPEVGEDIKVMALRRKTELSLTLAVAFVDRFIDDEKDYFRKKDDLVEAVRDFAWPGADIYINTLDRQERGINGTYLTVTGTSAEQGDCGQVGRGNRVNGLIPLNRPIGSEAAAGKNPVSHIGKIYNVLANVMAKKIHEKTSGVDELYVWMVNRIGDPIGAPMVSVQYAGEASEKDVRRAADDVINRELDNINRFTLDLAKGKYKVC